MGRAAAYAKQRVVFERPIGKNQAIQHLLAANWMALEAANLMVYEAASFYNAGKACSAEASAAKYLAGEACFDACQQAVMTQERLRLRASPRRGLPARILHRPHRRS